MGVGSEIWNLTPGGIDAFFLQPLENPPGGDRHLGIARLEARGIGRGAGPEAQPRDLADDLAVPLGEFERRHIRGEFDRRVLGEDVLQEVDPGLADAGLAIGQAQDMRSDRRRQAAEHRLAVGQRNAADEMHDRMPVAVCAHGVSCLPAT